MVFSVCQILAHPSLNNDPETLKKRKMTELMTSNKDQNTRS